MFIATKLEDIFHIPLSDFVHKISHDKFDQEKIKETENALLDTLNYNVLFPTHYDYLQELFFRLFSYFDT